MSEEVSACFGLQSPNEFTDAATQCLFRAFGAFAQERLACAVGSLDRIEVWGIRRQIAEGGASGFYRRLYAIDLV